MDVYAVDDDVAHILRRYARSMRYVNIVASAIDRLETVHEQLLLQHNRHVRCENDPQRFRLNHSVPQCSGPWSHSVVIRGVRDYVEFSISATNSVPAEANSAIRELLSMTFPVGVTAPAIIDGIPSSAGRGG